MPVSVPSITYPRCTQKRNKIRENNLIAFLRYTMNEDIFYKRGCMVQNTSNVASTPERRTAHAIHYDISYIVQGAEYGSDGAIVLLHDFPAGAFAWSDILPHSRV